MFSTQFLIENRIEKAKNERKKKSQPGFEPTTLKKKSHFSKSVTKKSDKKRVIPNE